MEIIKVDKTVIARCGYCDKVDEYVDIDVHKCYFCCNTGCESLTTTIRTSQGELYRKHMCYKCVRFAIQNYVNAKELYGNPEEKYLGHDAIQGWNSGI